MYNYQYHCECGRTVNIPILPEIEAKEDFNMAEITAQEQYASLSWWLHTASWFDLLKFWIKRGRK